jgi:hypothetical protein
MKRLLWGLFCLLCSGVVMADSWDDTVRKQVQASMLVTGTIVVTQDGSVNSYTLDQQNKLPSTVVNTIAQSLPHWKFAIDTNGLQTDLHDNQANLFKAKMSLRLVAVPVGDKNYAVSISGASFGGGADSVSCKDSCKAQAKPIYPRKALHDRIGGTVFVLVRVDRDGKVDDLVARQVNLRAIGTKAEMALWRNDLANAAVKAIQQWTFDAPTSGKEASQPYWYAMVPVSFDICSGGFRCEVEAYGKWEGYVPGPQTPTPWKGDRKAAFDNTDAMPSGVAFQPDQRLKLLTPLGKS